MKIEIIVEKNMIEEILIVLNNYGALKNTMITSVDLNPFGAFPHLDKIKLQTSCSVTQKNKIFTSIYPIIHKYGGACYVSNN